MNRIESLQGVRGFAILMIMISHCCYLKNSGDVNALGMLGGLGVELFIILSGYLVCYWNFDKFTDDSRINAKSCIIRTLKKVKKYYLLHVITMLVAVIVQWESIGEFIHRLYKFIIDLLLLQAWYPNMGVYFSYNAVAWYLSCSTFFIFMTPYVIRYLRKLDTRQTLNLMTKIVAFEFVWALVMPQERISHWLIYVFPVIRLLDFVLGGVHLCTFKKHKR